MTQATGNPIYLVPDILQRKKVSRWTLADRDLVLPTLVISRDAIGVGSKIVLAGPMGYFVATIESFDIAGDAIAKSGETICFLEFNGEPEPYWNCGAMANEKALSKLKF